VEPGVAPTIVGPVRVAGPSRLTRRSRGGNAAEAPVAHAFDDLVAREYAPMLRLAVLIVDDEGDAEEVVQEAFAAVHERWDRLDRPGGYLRGCVVNRARDVLRRRYRAARFRRSAPSRHEPAELGADHLLDALDTLTPTRRAAVVLRYYEGRSEAEIAELLGVRPGTVKSMLHRALAQLREEIEP
jgi:RNA polymerase sigma-70 factor (sigma-E family)